VAHFSEIPSMVHTIPFAGMRDSVRGLLVPYLKQEANIVVYADIVRGFIPDA
jgi:hypothetical protein